MKNLIKTSLFLSLVVVMASGCTQKTSSKKKTTSTVTNPSIDSGTGTGTDGSISNCPGGVYRAGATSCYYTNIPRLVFSGPGTSGITWWRSTSIGGSFSQNQFVTDATFALRMKPSASYANEASLQGRTCGQHLTSFTKMKLRVMLRRSIDSIGEIRELTATKDSYSNTARFTVPGGTVDPYIVEIVGIMTDHRCKLGSLTADMISRCNAGTYLEDIPVNHTAPTVTYCAAANLEFSTDSTYDLPN